MSCYCEGDGTPNVLPGCGWPGANRIPGPFGMSETYSPATGRVDRIRSDTGRECSPGSAPRGWRCRSARRKSPLEVALDCTSIQSGRPVGVPACTGHRQRRPRLYRSPRVGRIAQRLTGERLSLRCRQAGRRYEVPSDSGNRYGGNLAPVALPFPRTPGPMIGGRGERTEWGRPGKETMTMTHHAWRGEIGRQDLAGIGAQRARKTRGGLTTGPAADVWRISDLGAMSGGEIPGHVVAKLRAFAASRSADTGNGCPADDDWSPLRSPVPLHLGDWAAQKWHTVTLDDLDAPAGSARPRPRGYRTNGAVPTIPPAGMAELLTDLRWSREVAAGTTGRRARLAARAAAFAAF